MNFCKHVIDVAMQRDPEPDLGFFQRSEEAGVRFFTQQPR